MTCSSCPHYSALSTPPECRAKLPAVNLLPTGPTSAKNLPFPPMGADGWCSQHPMRIVALERLLAEIRGEIDRTTHGGGGYPRPVPATSEPLVIR